MARTAQRLEFQVQRVLQTADADMIVMDTRKEDRQESRFVVFRNVKQVHDYLQGNNSQEFEIWHTDLKDYKDRPWGFSYLVEDPGVRYHKDGSGTPPSAEMVEHGNTWPTLRDVVRELTIFIYNMRVDDFKQRLEEQLMYVNTNLEPIED